jgi:hypothetical protein
MSQDQLEEWQTKLSPTPWTGDHGEIYAADGSIVVCMYVRDEKFNVADERLIEAAPALLQAAKLLTELEDSEAHDFDTRWKTARVLLRAAIDHAEGRDNAAAAS